MGRYTAMLTPTMRRGVPSDASNIYIIYYPYDNTTYYILLMMPIVKTQSHIKMSIFFKTYCVYKKNIYKLETRKF